MVSSPGSALGPTPALSPSFKSSNRDLASETRDSSSVSSTSSLDRFAADYSGELPTSDLFSPPDVDDTFLMATGHDATLQRNDSAAETGSACRVLSASVACGVQGAEGVNSFFCNETDKNVTPHMNVWS